MIHNSYSINWNSKVPYYFQVEPKKYALLTLLVLASITVMIVGMLARMGEISGLNEVSQWSMIGIGIAFGGLTIAYIDKCTRSAHVYQLHQLLLNPKSTLEEITKTAARISNINAFVNGQTAVHLAVQHRAEAIAILFRFGADVQALNSEGRNPISLAVVKINLMPLSL